MNAPDTIALTEATTLSALAAAWRAAKRQEDDARARRYAIEAQICMELPLDGKEGTRTEKLDSVKVSVTYGLTRSVDTGALQDSWSAFDSCEQAAFRWKAELNAKEFRALAPSSQTMLARFITTKPAKPSVKVEVL
jgi:hypothetical protein